MNQPLILNPRAYADVVGASPEIPNNPGVAVSVHVPEGTTREDVMRLAHVQVKKIGNQHYVNSAERLFTPPQHAVEKVTNGVETYLQENALRSVTPLEVEVRATLLAIPDCAILIKPENAYPTIHPDGTVLAWVPVDWEGDQ